MSNDKYKEKIKKLLALAQSVIHMKLSVHGYVVGKVKHSVV